MQDWQPSTKPMTYAEWLEHGSVIDRLVIHFWAVWNNVDKQADIALQQALAMNSLEITAYCLDTDRDTCAHDWLRSDLRIITLPTVIGFSNGFEQGRVVGLQKSQTYQQAFTQWFA
jgi:hypothetical protein